MPPELPGWFPDLLLHFGQIQLCYVLMIKCMISHLAALGNHLIYTVFIGCHRFPIIKKVAFPPASRRYCRIRSVTDARGPSSKVSATIGRLGSTAGSISFVSSGASSGGSFLFSESGPECRLSRNPRPKRLPHIRWRSSSAILHFDRPDSKYRIPVPDPVSAKAVLPPAAAPL